MCNKSALLLMAGVLLAALSSQAGDITLNPQTRFQTIDGFGAYGTESFDAFGASVSDGFLRNAFDNLGMNINRLHIPPGGNNSGVIEHVRRLSAYAATKGIELRFIASAWSPPAWMKTNNSEIGGSINPANYGALGDHLVKFVRDIKTATGVEIYAVSLQNEPAFLEPYASCVYTPAQYRDALKAVAAKFNTAGLSTLLFGAEDMLDAVSVRPYFGTINQDSVARRELDIIAVHGYGDGIVPTGSSSAITAWKRLATIGASMRKPVWMTETSGYSSTTWEPGQVTHWDGSTGTVPGAFGLAADIFTALRYGYLSGWVWWTLSDYRNPPSCLILNGTPQRLFYVSKHYFRYIQPGAVRFEAISADSQVVVIAFAHQQKRTLSMVLMNGTTSQKTVTVSGGNAPSQMRMYRSSPSENCVDQGLVSVSNLALPARSVVTLTAENYEFAAVGVASGRAAGSNTLQNVVGLSATHRLVGIDGRVRTGTGSGVKIQATTGGKVVRMMMVGPTK